MKEFFCNDYYIEIQLIYEYLDLNKKIMLICNNLYKYKNVWFLNIYNHNMNDQKR